MKPGVWNVFPASISDHMSMSGGLLIKTDVLPIYLQFMTAICQLDEAKLGNGANTNTPNWLKNQKWYQKDAA